jgi:Cu/Ag efflux protein CusF
MSSEEGVDHSAMGHGAAPGTTKMSPNAGARGDSEMAQAQSDAPPSGTGTVHSVDAEQRTVNVSHEPIPSIGWPAMTMDFPVAPSVDLSSIQPGSRVSFTLARGANGTYVIEAFRPASADGGTMPGMNHEQMDHGSMPGMDH